MFGDRYEPVVVRFNDHSPQKPGQWFEPAMDKAREVLASAIAVPRLRSPGARVGCRVMSQLFALTVGVRATQETPGAFLGGLRVMAVDGTVLDVPDSQANARVFGYPSSRPGTRAAFPKVRLVMLIEAGTHLIVDALICPYRIGERVRAKKLLRRVSEGMVLMWDRGLHSYAMVQATVATGCDYLGRVPANVKFAVELVLDDGSYLSWIHPDSQSKKKGGTKICVRVIEYTIDSGQGQQTYRLITSLLDTALFPALLNLGMN